VGRKLGVYVGTPVIVGADVGVVVGESDGNKVGSDVGDNDE